MYPRGTVVVFLRTVNATEIFSLEDYSQSVSGKSLFYSQLMRIHYRLATYPNPPIDHKEILEVFRRCWDRIIEDKHGLPKLTSFDDDHRICRIIPVNYDKFKLSHIERAILATIYRIPKQVYDPNDVEPNNWVTQQQIAEGIYRLSNADLQTVHIQHLIDKGFIIARDDGSYTTTNAGLEAYDHDRINNNVL